MSVVTGDVSKRRQWRLAVALVIAASFVSEDAHAYIDPGTGSYYVQLIAAGFGGIALLARQLWYRIRHPSSRRPEDSAHVEPPAEGRDGDPRTENRAP